MGGCITVRASRGQSGNWLQDGWRPALHHGQHAGGCGTSLCFVVSPGPAAPAWLPTGRGMLPALSLGATSSAGRGEPENAWERPAHGATGLVRQAARRNQQSIERLRSIRTHSSHPHAPVVPGRGAVGVVGVVGAGIAGTAGTEGASHASPLRHASTHCGQPWVE